MILEGKNTESSRQALIFSVLICLVCLAPLAFLLFDLWRYPYLISGGLAMRIVAAGLLTKGESPYVDFWDWSQPIVFELLHGLTALCNFLSSVGIAVIPASFIPMCIFAALVASVILIAMLATQALAAQALVTEAPASQVPASQAPATSAIDSERRNIQEFALAISFAMVLTALIARFDFGELQYVLVFAIAPWFFLRWLNHGQMMESKISPPSEISPVSKVSPVSTVPKVSRTLAALVGLAAGCAACFDIPYLCVFIILELTLLLQSLRWRSLVSIEWLTFILALAANALYLMTLSEPVHTAFWQWTMPLKWLNYSIIDPAIVAPLSTPHRLDIIYCMVAAALAAFLLGKKHNVFAPLVALMLSGLGLFMLEGQGFSHDFTLTIFALVAIGCCLAFFALRVSRAPTILFIASTLVVTAVVCTSLELDRSKLQDHVSANISQGNLPLNLALEKTSKVNDSVTILSPYIEPTYPLLLFSGRKPGGYLLWSRPLWLFKWISDNSTFTGPMKDFHNHTWSNIESEIAQHRTDLFVAADDKVLNTFDHERFFHALRKGYLEVDTTGDYFSLGNHQPHEYCGSNPQFRIFVKREISTPGRGMNARP
ncbi:MAG: hypothetical protein WC714_07290 [Candidatus Obscuribacterales bacterium]|jgi:hypothetical protein